MRLQLLKVLSRTAAFLFLIFISIGFQTANKDEISYDVARLLDTVDPLVRDYPTPIMEALKALKRGVEYFSEEQYISALEALHSDNKLNKTALGDCVLFYRAESYLMLDRHEEALATFHLLKDRYPDSPLISKTLLRESQIWLELNDFNAALSALRDSRLEVNADTLYFQARALHEVGEKEKAIELYLKVYSNYVTSKNSSLAEDYLHSLSPAALTGVHNYDVRLTRAENLIRAGRARDARELLLSLGQVSAPNPLSSEKQSLLFADTERRINRPTSALSYLRKITPQYPELHAHAIYLEGICYRRLEREDSFLKTRDKALRLYPQSSFTEELLYSVATYFDVSNHPEKASEAYRAVCETFPAGSYAERALWRLAVLSYFQENYSEAMLGFYKYLLKNPNSSAASAAIYWMGRCCQKLGHPEYAKVLFAQVRRLANNSYYGQQAREAEAMVGKLGKTAKIPFKEMDFTEVRRTCEGIQLPPLSVIKPTSATISVIERVRQLVSADLADIALSELESIIRQHPQDKTLLFTMSRVYESKEAYNGVIVSLRRAFPDYKDRPPASLPEEMWKLLFPAPHWKSISEQASKNELSPELILAVIRQESAFAEQARSSSDARGLMQILPSTGRELARGAKVTGYTSAKLYSADINIALGTRYLASHLQYYGNEEYALAAYNAGKTRVDRWLKEFGNLDTAEFVERIPFSETRNYIKNVLSNKAHYELQKGSRRSG